MKFITLQLLIYSFVLLSCLIVNCDCLNLSKRENINEIYLKSLLSNINTTVNPCDNFYQYACGNWYRNYNSQDFVDMPGYMDNKVNKQLLEILNKYRNQTGLYEKVSNYYQSCVKLAAPAINNYLRIVEKDLNMEWPIFRDDWQMIWKNETNFDWLSVIARLRVYGLNGIFITQNINVRVTNGTHFLLEVYRHAPHLELLRENILQIFINFGMTNDESKIITANVIALEERMNNLTAEGNKADNDTGINVYKEITLRELQEKAPGIQWLKYFQIVLDRPVDVDKEVIQTFNLNFEYFDKLLATLRETTNETIAYYVMLKLMYHLGDEMPLDSDNSLHCVKQMRGYMPLAMNFLYNEHLYKPKRQLTDGSLIDIYDKLRLNFQKLIEMNNLGLNLNEESFLLDELTTMKLKIGNVPSQLSKEFVNQYYASVRINKTDFYGNHLQLLKFITRRQQEKLKNLPIPVDQHFYEHDPATASSSSPVKIFENGILVPYGYLQLPFFESGVHELFKYSLMGFILAHEIVHAFDLFHIVYDKNGNYNDSGVAIAQHFQQFIDCFSDTGNNINLSENMADITGLRLAYQTYYDDILNSNISKDFEHHLPSTNFTSQQLFFINSVQFLCANIAKISQMDMKYINLEHDMHDIRVRQNWANLEQFALAFQCKKGTTMNLNKKCRLW